MREEMENRLRSLVAEFEAGQKIIAELDERRCQLRDTLGRISGAIQVLQELLKQDQSGKEARDSAPATIIAA